MNLYHYTSSNGLYGIIEKQELHCSHINFLNDPTEGSYFDELLNSIISQSSELQNIHDTLFNRSYQERYGDALEIYIASFSESQDSLPMWNYYSKGNGYNIEISVDDLINLNQNEGLAIECVKMIYDEQTQKKELVEFIESHKSTASKMERIYKTLSKVTSEKEYDEISYEQNQLDQVYNDALDSFKIKFKHPAFKDEKEVRLVITENGFFDGFKKFRLTGNGTIVPYFPLALDLKSCVVSITSHPLNSVIQFEGARRYISSKIHGQTIHFKKSSIPFRSI